MADPLTAVVGGGALLGAGASYAGQRRATRESKRASQAQMAFEQQKYDDWQETYGPIQDNLANYYGSLTPEYYEAQGLEAFQQEQQAAMQSLEQSLAQRGIADSGIAAAAMTQIAQEGAENRATIRAAAPGIVADEQSRFLQMGLGQNPGASMSSALSQRSMQAGQAATAAQQAFGQSMQGAIKTVGTGLADYFRQPAPAQPTGTASAGLTPVSFSTPQLQYDPSIIGGS